MQYLQRLNPIVIMNLSHSFTFSNQFILLRLRVDPESVPATLYVR